MIRMSVTYPNKPGGDFDADYYLKIHMPMAAKLLGHALKAATAEIGVGGAAPGAPPAYAAIAGFTCESIDVFMQAFLPVADQLQGDIPNYTNIEPVIQFSELTGVSRSHPSNPNSNQECRKNILLQGKHIRLEPLSLLPCRWARRGFSRRS